jgi:hypothetical protein
MNFGLRSLSMMQRKQLFSITKIGWLNMLIVLKRSNAGIMGSNSAWYMLILPEFFFVVISKKSNEVWPSIQGVTLFFLDKNVQNIFTRRNVVYLVHWFHLLICDVP